MEILMPRNLLTASASGIEVHSAYVNILRENEDTLSANGMDYEEYDRKAEPLSATLIISIVVTTVLTEALKGIIIRIIDRLFDESKAEESKKEGGSTVVILRIDKTVYDLRKERDAAISKIESLGPE
jgi:hypothetical protein